MFSIFKSNYQRIPENITKDFNEIKVNYNNLFKNDEELLLLVGISNAWMYVSRNPMVVVRIDSLVSEIINDEHFKEYASSKEELLERRLQQFCIEMTILLMSLNNPNVPEFQIRRIIYDKNSKMKSWIKHVLDTQEKRNVEGRIDLAKEVLNSKEL